MRCHHLWWMVEEVMAVGFIHYVKKEHSLSVNLQKQSMWEIAFGWRGSGIVMEQDGRGSDRVTNQNFFIVLETSIKFISEMFTVKINQDNKNKRLITYAGIEKRLSYLLSVICHLSIYLSSSIFHHLYLLSVLLISISYYYLSYYNYNDICSTTSETQKKSPFLSIYFYIVFYILQFMF